MRPYQGKFYTVTSILKNSGGAFIYIDDWKWNLKWLFYKDQSLYDMLCDWRRTSELKQEDINWFNSL
jgi:hypothetical protein